MFIGDNNDRGAPVPVPGRRVVRVYRDQVAAFGGAPLPVRRAVVPVPRLLQSVSVPLPDPYELNSSPCVFHCSRCFV